MAPRSALVVDDSRSARYALRKSLEAHAFDVVTAESVRDAFHQLDRQRPSVIFLDHLMPDGNGLDALQQLQSSPETATIPVVICSSYDDPQFIQHARQAGALGVLPKPPTVDALIDLLSQLPSEPTTTAEPPTAATAELNDHHPDEPSATVLERSINDLRLQIDAVRADTSRIPPPVDVRVDVLAERVDRLEQRVGNELASLAIRQQQALDTLQRDLDSAMESLRRQQLDALDALRRQLLGADAELQHSLLQQVDAAREQTQEAVIKHIAEKLRSTFAPD